MTTDQSYWLYAVLTGLSGYMLVLTLFGRRIVRNRYDLVVGHFALTINFLLLTLVRVRVLSMIEQRWWLRAALMVYGLSLAIAIVRYWRDAWRARRRSEGA